MPNIDQAYPERQIKTSNNSGEISVSKIDSTPSAISSHQTENAIIEEYDVYETIPSGKYTIPSYTPTEIQKLTAEKEKEIQIDIDNLNEELKKQQLLAEGLEYLMASVEYNYLELNKLASLLELENYQSLTTEQLKQKAKQLNPEFNEDYFINISEVLEENDNFGIDSKILQKINFANGFESYNQILDIYDDTRKNIEYLNAGIYELENVKKTVKYEYMQYNEDYQNFKSKEYTITKDQLISVMVTKIGQLEYDYKTYCKKYGYVDEFSFMEACEGYTDNLFENVKCGVSDDILGLKILSDTVNPEYKKMYLYLKENEGNDKTKQYLEDFKSEINNCVGEAKANEFIETLSKDPNNAMEYIDNYIKEIDKGTTKGFLGFFENVENVYNVLVDNEKSKVYSVSEYESMYILQKLQENNYNIGDTAVYEISQSIGNMAPSIVISSVTKYPILGATSMGISAGGANAHQAMVENNGQDRIQAISYGVLSGISETCLESLLGGIAGIGDVEVNSLKTLLLSMGKEGLEESVQVYVDKGIRYYMFDEDIILSETVLESLKSGAYGAISAGVVNSVTSGVNIKNLEADTLQLASQKNEETTTISDTSITSESHVELIDLKSKEKSYFAKEKEKAQRILEQRYIDLSKIYEDYDYLYRVEDNNVEALNKLLNSEEFQKHLIDNSEYTIRSSASNNQYSSSSNYKSNNTSSEVNRVGYLDCNLLIELNNTSGLTIEMIEQLPDNCRIRIKGGYSDEYFEKGYNRKSIDRGKSQIYTKSELLEITKVFAECDWIQDRGLNQYEQAQYLYEYLKTNIKYLSEQKYDADSESYVSRKGIPYYENLIGLLTKEATTMGFCEIYKGLCDRLGIDCVVINGSLNGLQMDHDHIYTIVTIDGQSFIVDPVKENLAGGLNGFGVTDSSRYYAENDADLLENVVSGEDLDSLLAQNIRSNFFKELKLFSKDEFGPKKQNIFNSLHADEKAVLIGKNIENARKKELFDYILYGDDSELGKKTYKEYAFTYMSPEQIIKLIDDGSIEQLPRIQRINSTGHTIETSLLYRIIKDDTIYNKFNEQFETSYDLFGNISRNDYISSLICVLPDMIKLGMINEKDLRRFRTILQYQDSVAIKGWDGQFKDSNPNLSMDVSDKVYNQFLNYFNIKFVSKIL